MTEIILQALDDGVVLALTATGQIEVTGDPISVERWIPTIREHKPAIVAALQDDPAVTAIKAWLIADKADALACGMTDCRDCRNFRGDDRTCSAKKCPTPKTLFRRCESFKPTRG